MRTAIIDADHILWICLNGIKRLDENGEPIREDGRLVYDPKPFSVACDEADKYVSDILTVTRADQYIGFIGGSSKNRKSINPEYKAKRTGEKPDNFDSMKSYLTEKYNIISVTDHETDDYVASYHRAIPDSFTISPDKDINNLEGEHYNPKKAEWVTITSTQAKYAFWSDMITGQSGDGVKGLPGKGPKFAETNLKNIDSFQDSIGVVVFNLYIGHYKDFEVALDEFYKTYKCLKIKQDLEPTIKPIEWKNF